MALLTMRTAAAQRRALAWLAKALALAGLVAIATGTSGRAADITFLCAGALETSAKILIPEFEKTSGHHVKADFAAIGVITRRVSEGEAADLVTISPPQWEDLQKEGKLSPDVRVVIAKVGVGVFVKNGAPKPDIGSVEAFKHALLNARSIALADPAGGGPVGAYAVRLFDRLGVSADLKPKLELVSGGLPPIEPVVKGDAEFGLTTISEIVGAPDVELVGPLPADIQNFVVYTAAIPASAKESTAAKALIEFLNSPKAKAVMKTKGLEG
jgi:molybdate transport system substrate-binding protein